MALTSFRGLVGGGDEPRVEVTAKEPWFPFLILWEDANHDLVVQADELESLVHAGFDRTLLPQVPEDQGTREAGVVSGAAAVKERADAERICLTGQSVGAAEALALGLVDEVSAGDPMVDALAWLRTHTGSKSASSLRLAVRAVRLPFVARFKATLPEI